jgi:tetratricopeptide (TPR) repeat protein
LVGIFLGAVLALGAIFSVKGYLQIAEVCFGVVGLTMALGVLYLLRDVLAAGISRGPCHSGDYRLALKRIRRLGLSMPSCGMLDMEGGVLALAGENSGAEACLRRALAKFQGPDRYRAKILLKLAFTLEDLGRYDEARSCYQTVVQGGDPTGCARIGLAGLLLDQEGEPQTALEVIEHTEALTKPRWAIKARALARLGRRQEAEAAIEQALREADPRLRPWFAAVHYEVGRALIDLNEVARAREHLQAARDSDPHGNVGALAARKLP